jgi:glycerol-3-phosphate dehydrogenase (NAD(P)+)
MGYGDNAKAMLITRGMTEMARLGVSMGGKWETFAGLAGIGDLIVTCTSEHSRNRRAGILIGEGKSTAEAMEEVGAAVEGYYAAKAAWELAKKRNVDMPIINAAYAVLYQNIPAQQVVEKLLSRSRKAEPEDAGWN